MEWTKRIQGLFDDNAHSVYNMRRDMRFEELEKIIISDGWYLKNQKGSHRQYIHPTKKGKVTIPFHRGDLNIRTVRSILKQAGIEK